MAPYFQASDVFILPSVSEGLSNAMLEAMACGLACVVHPHGGALDAIENGISGAFLVDDTVASITSTVSDLLSCADTRARMGARARAVVVDRYSLDAVADQLATLYRELVTSKWRSPTCAGLPA